jgi:hypothetical protein
VATRSFIAVQDSAGFSAVYCHWDGYPTGVGLTLVESYSDRAKASGLVDLGDISVLGPEIGLPHGFDERFPDGDPRQQWCKFYGRDRGESDVETKRYPTLADLLQGARDCGCEFVYVLPVDGNRWKCSNLSGDVSDSLEFVVEIVRENVK